MRHSRYHGWFTNHAFTIVALLILSLVAWFEVSTAQVPTNITSDGTLGTEVNQSGDVYTITGGTRPDDGQNLFHSFGQFNVGTGDTANFSSDPGVNNIVGRVTGGSESMIDGTLQADANLFLLNPQGIMFGQNATLNINGSFHASTADELRLEDGSEFSTDISAKSTLTVAAPSAFGFLSENPAGITIEGSMLEVPEGETLSVVGGDIEIVGSPSTSLEIPSLDAQNGQINIASVASAGEVVLSPSGQGLHLNVDSFERLGEINISQGAFINTSGEGGGTVLIRSGKLVLDNAIIAAVTFGSEDGGGVEVEVEDLVLTDGALIITNTTGSGHGGKLTIAATESISISGRDSEGNSSALFSNTFGSGDSGQVSISTPILVMDSGRIQSGVSSEGTGGAGGITVEVGRLELRNRAQIDGRSFGLGHGGKLTITATESISISGRGSGFFSGAESEGVDAGNAGDLFVSAPILTMDDGRITAFTFGDGNAGKIEISVGRLELTGGAQISASSGAQDAMGNIFAGSGQGGNITVTATESIFIAGQSSNGFRSGIFNNSNGSGDGGPISLTTPLLTMDDGGRIVTRTLGGADAGDIDIQVGQLELKGGSQIFSGIGDARPDGSIRGIEDGIGRGGNVTVIATESIVISGQDIDGFFSGITSNAQIGNGDAGDIFLSAPSLDMQNRGFISTGTSNGNRGNAGDLRVEVGRLTLTAGAQIRSSTFGPGQGGKLTVTATESIFIAGQSSDGFNSGIFSTSNSSGDGGAISLTTPLLTADNGGRLVSRTLGGGDAGNIDVQVGRLELKGGSQIFSGTGDARPDGSIRGIEDGTGRGGTVTVIATESIFIAGRDSESFESGIFSSGQIGAGGAGNIFVSAPRLEMRESGNIGANSIGLSRGNAGSLTLEVETLDLTAGAQISSLTRGIGQGGNVIIKGERLFLSNGASISSESSGDGDAGDIRIMTSKIALNGDSTVTTEATQADGGNIIIESEVVSLTSSSITAEAMGASQMGSDGGSVTIRANQIALNRSVVKANAEEGNGGTINIIASESFVVDAGTCLNRECLDASSQGGNDGTVEIQEPDVNLSDTVTFFPQSFSQEATLLRNQCASRLREGSVSSFVERGREDVSAYADGILPRRLYRITLDHADTANAARLPTLSQPPGTRWASVERDLVGIRPFRVDSANLPEANCREQ